MNGLFEIRQVIISCHKITQVFKSCQKLSQVITIDDYLNSFSNFTPLPHQNGTNKNGIMISR